jgi:type VI secretion system secreted protein Hcp
MAKIDAFLFFCTGSSGGAWSKRVPTGDVHGETYDHDLTQSLGSYGWPAELKTYHFGFEMTADWAENKSGNTKTPHRPKLAPLTVTKAFDMASPKLLEAIHNASLFDTVKLIHRRAGGANGHQQFLVITLGIVAVLGVDWDASEDGNVTETVKLDFCTIDLTYMPQHSKGGDDTADQVTGKSEVDFPKRDSDRTASLSIDETKLENWIADVAKATKVKWDE